MARLAFVSGRLVVVPDEPTVPVAGVSGPQIGLQVPAPVTGYTRAAVPVSSGYTPGLRLPSPTGYTQGVSLPAPTGYSAGVPLRSSTVNDMVPRTPSKVSLSTSSKPAAAVVRFVDTLDPSEQQVWQQGIARGDNPSDVVNRIAKLRKLAGGRSGLPSDVSEDVRRAAFDLDKRLRKINKQAEVIALDWNPIWQKMRDLEDAAASRLTGRSVKDVAEDNPVFLKDLYEMEAEVANRYHAKNDEGQRLRDIGPVVMERQTADAAERRKSK